MGLFLPTLLLHIVFDPTTGQTSGTRGWWDEAPSLALAGAVVLGLSLFLYLSLRGLHRDKDKLQRGKERRRRK